MGARALASEDDVLIAKNALAQVALLI